MSKEFLYALADAAGNYDVVGAIGTISGGVQKLVHGGEVIRAQKELKEKSMECQLEYEVKRMEHEDRINMLKSKNYIETLRYFTEANKAGILSESEKTMILSTLNNTNNELK